MSDLRATHGRYGRILVMLGKLFALAGGAVLALLTLMSLASVAGRLLGRPIQGDFEMMQLGAAAAISFFLPYCQLKRANIIVDFFTVRSSVRTQGRLDALGALLLALVMALLAWRTGAGTLVMEASNETSMIVGIPIWYSYAAVTPALALTALCGLHCAWQDWNRG